MARTIQIPIAFEFRTIKVKWIEAEGHIVGLGGENEVAMEITKRGRAKRLKFWYRDLPFGLWDKVQDALREDDYDDAIERICSDFRPNLFVPHIKNYDSDFDEMKEIKGSLPADAWYMREAFLRAAGDSHGILLFLNRWGLWEGDGYVHLPKILCFQESVRNALVSPPAEWLEGNYSDLDLMDRKSEYPFFTMETVECEPAIRATVTIDLLRQVKFETCARPDCGQPFPIISKHKRKYCSQYCGHLESVRRGRAM